MLKKIKKHEFIVLLIWPIIASVLSVVFNAQIYLSLILFFGVPSLYLSWRHRSLIKKSLVFSLIFSIPAAFVLDYTMELTKGWAIGRIELPNIFILQYVSVIQIIWLVLYTYFIVIYYEAFFDRSVQKIIYPKTRRLILMGVSALGLILFAHIFFPSLLYIEYFYLKIGIIAILFPLIGVLANSPSLYPKFFKVGIYFFFYTLLYEITALQLDQWSFPAKDQFIGHIVLLGHSFPFEELFFWIMISSISTLSYYEYFEDDDK